VRRNKIKLAGERLGKDFREGEKMGVQSVKQKRTANWYRRKRSSEMKLTKSLQ
jgi:hypothetical protein